MDNSSGEDAQILGDGRTRETAAGCPSIIYQPIYVALSPSDLRRCRQGWVEWKEGRLIRNVVCVWHCPGAVLYTCPVLAPPETRQGTQASNCHSQTDHSPASPRRSHLVAALITPSRRCVRERAAPLRRGPGHRAQRPGGSRAGKTCSVSKLCQGRSVSCFNLACGGCVRGTGVRPAISLDEQVFQGRGATGRMKLAWVFYPLYIRLHASELGAQSLDHSLLDLPAWAHHVIQDLVSCPEFPVPHPTVSFCALQDESLLALPASESLYVQPCLPSCSGSSDLLECMYYACTECNPSAFHEGTRLICISMCCNFLPCILGSPTTSIVAPPCRLQRR